MGRLADLVEPRSEPRFDPYTPRGLNAAKPIKPPEPADSVSTSVALLRPDDCEHEVFRPLSLLLVENDEELHPTTIPKEDPLGKN